MISDCGRSEIILKYLLTGIFSITPALKSLLKSDLDDLVFNSPCGGLDDSGISYLLAYKGARDRRCNGYLTALYIRFLCPDQNKYVFFISFDICNFDFCPESDP